VLIVAEYQEALVPGLAAGNNGERGAINEVAAVGEAGKVVKLCCSTLPQVNSVGGLRIWNVFISINVKSV
jgi:hypothetical protein